MIDEPECSKRNCIHYQGILQDAGEESERPVCSAFPNGIPDEIAYGDNKHTEPVDGQDNEITYESP